MSGTTFIFAAFLATGHSLVLPPSSTPSLVCQSHCDNCTRHDFDIELKCGSDRITYLNQCELQCAQEHCDKTLKLAHDGICVDQDTATVTHDATTLVPPPPYFEALSCDPYDDCDCTYDLLLTCGTDGQTYPNPCTLNCAKKCKHDLQIIHYGAC